MLFMISLQILVRNWPIKQQNHLKYLKGAFSGLRQFLGTENPLNIMKNGFDFTLKAVFVLEIFQFCSEYLVMYENGLIRKLR